MKCGNESSNESLPNAKMNSIRKRMLIPIADSVNKENNQTATSNFIIVMVLMLLWPAARMFGHFLSALNWYLIYNSARNIPGMFSQKRFLLVQK